MRHEARTENVEGTEAWERSRRAKKGVLAGPRAEIQRRIEEHRADAARNPQTLGPKEKAFGMNWIDDLADALRFRDQEQAQREAGRHLRLVAVQEQGPVVLSELARQLQLAAQHPAFRGILVNVGDRSVAARHPDRRPITKVTAHLNITGMPIRAETSPSAGVPLVETANESIDFGLDSNNKLSLCLRCEPIASDDVAKRMLEYVYGLT